MTTKTPTTLAVAPKSVQPEAGKPAVNQDPPQPSHGASHWWVWLVVAAVAVGSVFGIVKLVRFNANRSQAANDIKKAKHDTPVVTATATKGNLQIYLTGLGTVTPLATVNLHTRVDGQIMKIFWKEGDLVKKDQPLFLLDDKPYLATLAQANGQKAKDEAALANATSTVKMDSEAGTGISQQQKLTDQAAMDQDKAAIEVDKAAIESAQVNVNYCHINAPCDGRIGLRKVDEGNIVHAADTTALAVITQLTPITVVFTLPEDSISRVQRQIATGKPVEVLAFNRDLTVQLGAGTLEALDSQIDLGSGTLAFKAKFENKDLKLFPNEFVNARVQVEKLQNVLMVPSAAIQPGTGTSGPYVYVVTGMTTGDAPSGTVKLQPVTVGPSQPAVRPGEEDRTVVTSGLNPGDVVVIDGVDKLINGSKVSARMTKPTTRPAANAGSDLPEPTTGPSDEMPATGPTTEPAGEPMTAPRQGGGRRGKTKNS